MCVSVYTGELAKHLCLCLHMFEEYVSGLKVVVGGEIVFKQQDAVLENLSKNCTVGIHPSLTSCRKENHTWNLNNISDVSSHQWDEMKSKLKLLLSNLTCVSSSNVTICAQICQKVNTKNRDFRMKFHWFWLISQFCSFTICQHFVFFLRNWRINIRDKSNSLMSYENATSKE